MHFDFHTLWQFQLTPIFVIAAATAVSMLLLMSIELSIIVLNTAKLKQPSQPFANKALFNPSEAHISTILPFNMKIQLKI